MEEQLLEHIKLQRPPLVLCLTAGTMLILSALQFTLSDTAQKHAPVSSHAVFTPIQLPSAAKSIKPQRNPFLAPAAPDIKCQTAALTPVLKGTVQNGSTIMAIMEFAGQSNYYQPGSKINGFTVRSITPNSVLKIFTALLTALLAAVSPLAYANGITLNVRDGLVRDVLASIAALSGKSIVADSSVQGTVTLNLKDVPFDTALRIITAAKGLSYRLTGDVILVGSAAGMEKFNDTASIIKLNYAKAEELKTALDPLIGTNSKISTDTVTNSIIFTGTPTDEMRLRSAVAALDTATQQVTLEAKIIAVNREDSENLGISWNWDKIPQNNNYYGNDDDSDDSDNENFGGVVHFGANYEFRFNAALNALFAKGKAKILATPRIITIPGREASIFIGDHIPVTTEKIENSVTTNTTDYVDAGIKLQYTPIVSSDGMITSVVHTEVSTPTLISELKNYKITSRSATTTVRMRDGETLVIGGLINEEEQKRLQKVPFLSNIPLLGELFKNRTTSKTKTEVIMILTPHLTNPGESPAIYDSKLLESGSIFDDNN